MVRWYPTSCENSTCACRSGTGCRSSFAAEVVDLLVQRLSQGGINFVGSVNGARFGVVIVLVLAHFECLHAGVAGQLCCCHRSRAGKFRCGIAGRAEIHLRVGQDCGPGSLTADAIRRRRRGLENLPAVFGAVELQCLHPSCVSSTRLTLSALNVSRLLSRRSFRLLCQTAFVIAGDGENPGIGGQRGVDISTRGRVVAQQQLLRGAALAVISNSTAGGSRPYCLRSAAFSSTTRSAFSADKRREHAGNRLLIGGYGLGSVICHLPAAVFLSVTGSFCLMVSSVTSAGSTLRITGAAWGRRGGILFRRLAVLRPVKNAARAWREQQLQ